MEEKEILINALSSTDVYVGLVDLNCRFVRVYNWFTDTTPKQGQTILEATGYAHFDQEFRATAQELLASPGVSSVRKDFVVDADDFRSSVTGQLISNPVLQITIHKFRDELTGELSGLTYVATEVSDERGAQREREALNEMLYDQMANIQELNSCLSEQVVTLEESRKAYQTELEQRRSAEARLLREIRTRSDILSVMSHEVRTPLSGVLGIAEVLQSTPLSEQQAEMVHVIRSSGEMLLVIHRQLDLRLREDRRGSNGARLCTAGRAPTRARRRAVAQHTG